MSDSLFYSLLIPVTAYIAYQDFKDRLVSLWLLILYVFTTAVFTYTRQGWLGLLENGIGVLAYFGLCFSVLFVYYFIKEKKIPRLVDRKIGTADLIIFLAIGLSLSLPLLIIFFTIAFCLAALATFVFIRDRQSVPLAGMLVVIYIVFLLFRKLAEA